FEEAARREVVVDEDGARRGRARRGRGGGAEQAQHAVAQVAQIDRALGEIGVAARLVGGDLRRQGGRPGPGRGFARGDGGEGRGAERRVREQRELELQDGAP